MQHPKLSQQPLAFNLKWRYRLLPLLVMSAISGSPLADDGELLQRSISSPERLTVPRGAVIPEAEHAFITRLNSATTRLSPQSTLELNGNARSSADLTTPTEVIYRATDGSFDLQVDQVQPLIGVYISGSVSGVDGTGFVGHGQRDAYAAVSFDDGQSWRRTNLSRSADLSSSAVVRRDIKLFSDTGFNYPGDVVNIFLASADNRMLVVWPSRYCDGGNPNYALDETTRSVIANRMGIDLGVDEAADGESVERRDAIYLTDLFGVRGEQQAVDYSGDSHEPNRAVGQVPYSCLWSARGVLRTDGEGSPEVVWFKPERLTSGARDVNRVEAQCVAGAGCAVTWQEDPGGLRPGQGEGPGEGWSGAIANNGTDIWYSYLPWEHFDLVANSATQRGKSAVEQSDYTIAAFDTYLADVADSSDSDRRPQPAIPMAMPMRITDNAKCNISNPLPYCNGAGVWASTSTSTLIGSDFGLADSCADTVNIETNSNSQNSRSDGDICVTERGFPLLGNTASTRPRLMLFPTQFAVANPAILATDTELLNDDAWVVLVAERSKGMGAFCLDAAGEVAACLPDVPASEQQVIDDGKDLWYYSFSMRLPHHDDNSPLDERDRLLAHLAGRGHLLNQPEQDYQSGEPLAPINTQLLWDFDGYNYDIYRTEIARRGSLLAQPLSRIGGSGLAAFPSWKQGIMNQGGPADVMARRIIAPDNLGGANPYAFRNMACDAWIAQEGNPYYPDGICAAPAINLSATIPVSCVDSATATADSSSSECPYGAGQVDPVLLAGPLPEGEDDLQRGDTTKVLSWMQCQGSGGAELSPLATDSDVTVTPLGDCRNRGSTLDDQSWENPYDVAKGHRGYLDGDFVMLLYAWSPNWRLNRVGRDRYDLYVRRSFDGGVSWGTLPGDYRHQDGATYQGAGTVSCETYRNAISGDEVAEPRACYQYDAGRVEQARNVSQLPSMRFTILDPRYASTAAASSDMEWRDPSRYFIVYESGDNSTTAVGEAEPLDLHYSRALGFGDHYTVAYEPSGDTLLTVEAMQQSNCYPNRQPATYLTTPPETGSATVIDTLVGSGFCNEFDDLEGKRDTASSEASLQADSGGMLLYSVWAQEQHHKNGRLIASDAMFRRVFYNPVPDSVDDEGASAAVIE